MKPFEFGPQSSELPSGIVPGTNTLTKSSLGDSTYLKVTSRDCDKVNEKVIKNIFIKSKILLLSINA
tara:strand:- start:680 stop:880 length:201 start_codon:yes stop_codon:yes gene_type:complete